MILGLETSLIVFSFSAILFRLLFSFNRHLAFLVFLFLNFLALAFANPFIPMMIAGQFLLVFLLHHASRRLSGPIAGFLPWLAFLGLVPANLQHWLGASPYLPFRSQPEIDALLGPGAIFWFAGSSFLVLKSFVALREWQRAGKVEVLPALALLSFPPSYPAGPISGQEPFRMKNITERIMPAEIGRSLLTMGWGIAAFYVIAPEIREISGKAPLVARIYLDLAALFFDFSGYSIMAIAIAAWFGFTLPPNFNRPYLATSIREFWQRWHMSLSWFIATYLYKPFVRRTGSPQRGIFLAFVFAGLWHEVAPGYLIWGIGHGAALSLAMKPPAIWLDVMRRMPPGVQLFIGWFATMTWVAVLSYLANHLLKG